MTQLSATWRDRSPALPRLAPALRWLAVLVVSPVALGVIAYLITRALGGQTTGNPLLTAAAALLRIAVPTGRGDSWDPMIQALDIARASSGPRLYDLLFFQLHQKFQYAPTSLLWLEGLGRLIPITPLNLNRLNALAFVLDAAGCVLLLDRVAREWAPWAQLGRTTRLCAAALAAALPFVFWPTLYGFTVGQIQVWIDLLFTLALLFWLQDRKLACGIAIGLACTIKPQLGLLLVWGVLWRERDFTIGLVGTLLVLGAVSVLRYGLPNHENYLDVLSYISRHGESFRANQSVNGLLNRMLFLGNNTEWDANAFPPYNATVYLGTLLTGLAFMAWPLTSSLWAALRGLRQRAGVLDLCTAALCFTMASPVAWEHHYGIVLPVYIIAFALALTRTFDVGNFAIGRRAILILLGLSWLLVGSKLQAFDLLSATSLNILQDYVFFGALLLLVALACMAGGVRAPARHTQPSFGQ